MPVAHLRRCCGRCYSCCCWWWLKSCLCFYSLLRLLLRHLFVVRLHSSPPLHSLAVRDIRPHLRDATRTGCKVQVVVLDLVADGPCPQHVSGHSSLALVLSRLTHCGSSFGALLGHVNAADGWCICRCNLRVSPACIAAVQIIVRIVFQFRLGMWRVWN